MSVVFSLNGAVAELSRDESAGQAHLIVNTIENVIRGAFSGVPNTACVAGAEDSAPPRGDSQEGSMLVALVRRA